MSDGPKYVLLPGDVVSAKDGDHHYINNQKLIFLYKVSALDCVIYDEKRVKAEGSHYYRVHKWKLEQLIPLAPDFYGKYTVPLHTMKAEDLKAFEQRAEWADADLRFAAEQKERREKEKLKERVRLAELGFVPRPTPRMRDDRINEVPAFWPFPVVHGKIPG